MKNRIRLGFILLFVILSNMAFAMPIDLYRDEIPVHSQATEDKQKAIAQALANVFIKVSGSEQVISNPRIKNYLLNASRMVQQIGYIASTDKSYPYLLQIRFDINAVNQCLRVAGAPIWDTQRPSILGLIIDETEHPATMLHTNASNATTRLIEQHMKTRGMPFILPHDPIALDHHSPLDMATLSPYLTSYKSNAVLIGKIYTNSDRLNAEWKLIMGPEQWSWNLTGKTIQDILPVLMNHISTTLSSKFAIVTSNHVQKTLSIKILGITKQHDFSELVRYLNRLTPVANVSILHINGTSVLLKVGLRSTEESFIQALSLEHKLSMVQPNQPSCMTLQWNHS